MERTRSNRRSVMIALRVAVIAGLAGCSNQQMSASNPFMAPDRVPPPATRTIAPGTAAPYYPGDPVPSAQVPPGVAGAQVVAQTPPVAAPPVAPPATSPAQSTAPQPLAFNNERSVAVPTDNQDLRFTASPAQPPITPIDTPAPVQQAVATAPATPQVAPAAYNQPVASQPLPAASPVPSATPEEATSGPWRSPQIAGDSSPVMQAQYVQPQQVQPNPWQVQPTPQPAPTAATMPVQLQAVPSPANVPTTAPAMAPTPQMAPITTPPPRMRFPSWTDPTTWFTPQPAATAPQPGQQLIGYMVPGPNGQMQMVSVEQMQAMTSGTAQSATNVASSDGFRPRGSSTK